MVVAVALLFPGTGSVGPTEAPAVAESTVPSATLAPTKATSVSVRVTPGAVAPTQVQTDPLQLPPALLLEVERVRKRGWSIDRGNYINGVTVLSVPVFNARQELTHALVVLGVAAMLWMAMPVIFGVAFAAVATTAALYWPKAVMVEALQPVVVLGATFCTGFVPVDKYPDWVQPVVRYQPMSPAVDAMRGLSVGGPVLAPLVSTLLWCAAILAVCLWPIMVGYRKASTSR